MRKKVLLLCASHNDLGLIRGLRKLNYEIIVTGAIRGLIGEKYCDKYIQADYSDRNLILKIAQDEKIDRICACCNDYGVYTAAYVAEKMNLPGYDSYETTCVLHNKDRFKSFVQEHNIPSPWTKVFTDYDEAKEFLKSAQYPLIVKPTDCSAGNGITKLESFSGAEEAVKYAFEKTRAGVIVIEQYIEGTQHGFCSFLVNQKVRAYINNNEYSIQNPYRVEIDTFPADNSEDMAGFLVPEIEKIANILNLKDGIFHLQYIVSNGQPKIIEVMRRAIGNMYSVPGDLISGIPWDYWEARARCGMSCDDFPINVTQEGYFAYKAILSEKNGIIKDICIPKEYDEYILSKCILKHVGDVITHCQSEPIGFIFMMFRSDQEMKRVLIENYRSDLVVVD